MTVVPHGNRWVPQTETNNWSSSMSVLRVGSCWKVSRWRLYLVIGAEQRDESFPVGEIIVHPVVTRNVEVGQDPGPS